MSEDFLSSSLQFVKGVGPLRAAELARAGYHTYWDLLRHFPFRYEDRRDTTPIGSIEGRAGEKVVVRGRIAALDWHRARHRRLTLVKVLLTDDTGFIPITFFNQAYLRDTFKVGMEITVYGKVSVKRELTLEGPRWELATTPHGVTGRVVPIYPAIGPFSTTLVGRFIGQVLDKMPEGIPDPLPADLLNRKDLPAFRKALFDLHHPPSLEEHKRGRDRLIFDELFTYELSLLLNRKKRDTAGSGPAIAITDAIRKRAREVLPFKLTQGQRDALREIVLDMASGKPMQRLLQGDVGCGKTIVAAIAAVVAMENGFQTAYMAPTSILAEQHHERLSRLFAKSGTTVRLLTAGTPAAERRKILKDLASGAIRFMVGTHALLEPPVEFQHLGFCIVDEEHRFGVRQRKALREKGDSPHYLVMSATPIPRTLTLTIYGDMDISTINQMPPGRRKIKTYLRTEEKRPDIYAFIRDQAAQGRQAFLVYPLIEESENFDAKALTAHVKEVAAAFPDLRVGMLHGRLPYREKDAVMRAFAAGEIQVMVSTTVIEVGVDVPNAAVMLVENAERFGLSQLHQLRGRIGRAEHASYCILMAGSGASEDSLARLRIFEKTDDGFVLAEQDLDLRGPGDLLGLRQWGLPKFRAADIFKDRVLLTDARKTAQSWLDGHTVPECEALLKRLLMLWDFQEGIL